MDLARTIREGPHPVSAHERIDLIDVVRGFALFGVLLANLVWITTDVVLTDARLSQLPTAPLDRIVKPLVVFFGVFTDSSTRFRGLRRRQPAATVDDTGLGPNFGVAVDERRISRRRAEVKAVSPRSGSPRPRRALRAARFRLSLCCDGDLSLGDETALARFARNH